MLKNKTKNNHADPYHPSDLFNLNGEGVTWEETKQGEQDKKQHVLAKGLVCLLIFAADIVFLLNAETILHSLGAFSLPLILFVGSLLGALSFWAFVTLVLLYAYLHVRAIVWYRMYLMEDDTSTDSSEDNVFNYVRDNSNSLKQHIDKILHYEEERKTSGRSDFNAYKYCSKRLEKLISEYPKPVGKISAHTIARTPVYLPIQLDDKNLKVYIVHSENFPYENTLTRCDFWRNSTRIATSARNIDLRSIKNINEYFEALPDLFAKDEMRDALTAYIYAEHQYYEVEKTARRVLPEWTDDDSVLLEDYASLRRWYANYRETCMNRIISLIEDYARELEFKNAQKRNRSEAISRALTV